MSTGLLHTERKRPRGPRAVGWRIGDVTYTHSAATFWPALLDEVFDCFPGCRRIGLSALSDHTLDESWLDPAANLEAAMADLSDDPAAGMKKIIDELELAGPPSAVAIDLHDETGLIYDDFLPLDTVDAEVFLFLLSWLLRWGALPAATWCSEQLNGAFTADAPGTGRRYEITFDCRQTPGHEGLIRRDLSLQCTVTTGHSRLAGRPHGIA